MAESICATLSFVCVTPDVKPHEAIRPLTPESEGRGTNIQTIDIPNVRIHNARFQQESFSINDQGFEFHQFQAKPDLFGGDDSKAEGFQLEMCEFLKEKFLTPHVFTYDLRVSFLEYKHNTDSIPR